MTLLQSSPLLLGGLLIAVSVRGSSPAATAREEGPIELGRVAWMRDLDAALAVARDEEKPVFALFQEIPGCLTCRRFGAGPLSDPLLVEAIEDLFVPLAIHNNRPGADARVLERYGEPAWNNPVVRFLDADGEDLIARADRVWSTSGVARRIVAALGAAGQEAPRWLSVAVAESDDSLATATFTMHCFWQGEVGLGGLDGVVTTRAGWHGGREVVEVRYDPDRLPTAELERAAERLHCSVLPDADARDAKASDRKFHLRRSPLRFLPLTPMQRTKVNAALGRGGDAGEWLSPRQRRLLGRVSAAAPERLQDLEAPERTEELAAYERELRRRLDG